MIKERERGKIGRKRGRRRERRRERIRIPGQFAMSVQTLCLGLFLQLIIFLATVFLMTKKSSFRERKK